MTSFFEFYKIVFSNFNICRQVLSCQDNKSNINVQISPNWQSWCSASFQPPLLLCGISTSFRSPGLPLPHCRIFVSINLPFSPSPLFSINISQSINAIFKVRNDIFGILSLRNCRNNWQIFKFLLKRFIIYTAQGFEFDYVGVIIGNDLHVELEIESSQISLLRKTLCWEGVPKISNCMWRISTGLFWHVGWKGAMCIL